MTPRHRSIDTLTRAFDAPFDGVPSAGRSSDPTVLVSSPSVPIELIRAAGLVPVMVRGEARETPDADWRLEPGAFSRRIRCLVDAALTGALRSHGQVVLPRTSDQDYKGFLYLREFQRINPGVSLPPIYLLDILQSDASYVRAYSCDRLRGWLADLDARTGRSTTEADIQGAIAAANAARAAARRLVALRRGVARVRGAEVFPLLGAYWTLPPDTYAALAHQAADALSAEAPLGGPRILLAGSPVETSRLHRAIEDLGAVVTAELSPWGSGVVGDDVGTEGDPIEALFDHYRGPVFGARAPVRETVQAFERALAEGIAGVVFVLPASDDVHGWDVPRFCRMLDDRQMPHARLGADEFEPWSSSDLERIVRLVQEAARRQETHARG